MNLFYVVKVGSEWAILEMTANEMHDKVKREPELADNLDRAPFQKRSQAETRRDWLNKQPRSNEPD